MRASLLVVAVFGSMYLVPAMLRAEDQFDNLNGRSGLRFEVPPGKTLAGHYEFKVFNDGYECEFVVYRDQKRVKELTDMNSYKRKAGTFELKNETIRCKLTM